MYKALALIPGAPKEKRLCVGVLIDEEKYGAVLICKTHLDANLLPTRTLEVFSRHLWNELSLKK